MILYPNACPEAILCVYSTYNLLELCPIYQSLSMTLMRLN